MKIEAGIVAHNTGRLSHVMRVLDANRLSDFLLIECSHIRFTYDSRFNDHGPIRFIYYNSGHVTIADTDRGIEIGGMIEAQDMKDLLCENKS